MYPSQSSPPPPEVVKLLKSLLPNYIVSMYMHRASCFASHFPWHLAFLWVHFNVSILMSSRITFTGIHLNLAVLEFFISFCLFEALKLNMTKLFNSDVWYEGGRRSYLICVGYRLSKYAKYSFCNSSAYVSLKPHAVMLCCALCIHVSPEKKEFL